MSSSTSPLFIVGANRSGTTLLRLILNAHSRIAVPDELVYFDFNFSRDSFHPWQNPTVPREQYERFVRRFLNNNEEALAPLSIARLYREILSSPVFDLREPYAHVLGAWASHHGKVRWGEKTPGNLFYADLIHEMFPEALFIYLMRDPRAGVNSMNRSVLFSEDTIINALNRRKYMRDGVALLRASVPARQRILIKYEDLVAEPESTIRSLCSFIGEDFEPQMLEFHEDAERYMKPRAVETFNRAATRPIQTSRIDAWRDTLSPEDVAVIEWICDDSMQEYGYQREGTVPSLAAKALMLLKTLYWRYKCRTHSNSPGYIHQSPVLARFRKRAKEYLNEPVVRRATDPPT
jgi:LPS sulfotransferase NodH